jgi:tyrosine-protein phosphatase YwqE
MKKRNKKKNKCVITTLWSSVEAMKKYLFINLEEQEVFKVSNGKKFKKTILVGTGKNNKPYVVIAVEINKKSYKLRLHRLFFYWKYNYLPPLVDHIDRNSFNNNIENLRDLDASGNASNSSKRKNTSSKYKGVHWRKEIKKWIANVFINYKNIYIGAYTSEDDAGQAYNDKVRELGLEEVSVLNDTPQERTRKVNLFNEKKEPLYS